MWFAFGVSIGLLSSGRTSIALTFTLLQKFSRSALLSRGGHQPVAEHVVLPRIALLQQSNRVLGQLLPVLDLSLGLGKRRLLLSHRTPSPLAYVSGSHSPRTLRRTQRGM